MANKKVVSVLSTAAIGTLIATAVGSTVFAAVDGLVVKNAAGSYLNYDLDALKASVVNDALGQAGSELYKDFDVARTAGSIVSYHDNKVGFVDAAAVQKAALDSALAGTSFALDTFTESSKETILPATVYQATVTNGKVVAGAEVKPTSTPVATALAVESVSALNAKQIKVVFNKAVNEASAETIGNYFSNGVALVAPSVATLQSDAKTVIITLNAALANNSAYAIKVSGVRDANGVALATDYIVSLLAKDLTAPTFVSATAKAKTTTNTITLTFSEPVDFTVASVTVNGVFASLSAGTDATQVVVTTGANLVAGSSYDLSIMNIKDAVGNFMATNPLAASVAVVADAVAPSVTNVAFTRDNNLQVTFDKAIDIATLSANVNIKLLDTTMTATGALGAAVAADTTNKVFNFPVAGIAFNTANVFSGVVVLNTSVADTSGNVLATAVTRNVSVNKDVAKPQVVSTVYKSVTSYGTINAAGTAIATANGCIVVKFNEPITAVAAPAAYTIVDNLGGAVAAPAAVTVNYSDNTELVVALGAAVATGITNYMVLVPTGAAADLSVAANQSAAIQQFVSVTAGAPVASDVTAPTVGAVTTTSVSNVSGQTIVVPFVELGSGLDLATVVNVNNYRLDGLPLPTGSYVTYNSVTTTATINIPAGLIAKDKTAVGTVGGYVFNVTGVKDKAGNTVAAFVGNLTLKDDIKPTMTAGVINTNGTLSLGFSETVNTAVGKEADFIVKLNGSTLTANALTYVLADGAGADAGKYVLTVKTQVDNNNLATLKDTLYIDVNANGAYDAGTDIVVLQQASAGTDYVAGTYNLSNAATLTVTTAVAPASVTDTSAFTNALTGSTIITVK